MSDTEHETASLTADIVVLADDETGAVNVLVVQRGHEPYAGCWALPGGYLDAGERPEAAAARELAEETGTSIGALRLVGVYADPDRDPRGRVVSFAYRAWLDSMPTPTAGDDAAAAAWVPVSEVFDDRLAFDHNQILVDALRAQFDDERPTF